MPEEDLSQFRDIFISEAKENLTRLNICLLELEKNFKDKASLNEIFRVAHTLKGMAATMGFDIVAELTHEMEEVLDILRKGEKGASADTIDTLFSCFDTLELLLEGIAKNEQKFISIAPLIEKLRQITETKNDFKTDYSKKEIVSDKTEILNKTNEPEVMTKSSKTKAQTVRVKIEHLDKLMNLVGEIVINKARLTQIANRCKDLNLESTLSQFDRISVELQEEVLKTRMVPVGHVFERYPRMIRDLSKRLNKEIEFQMVGSDIEIDRTLLEEINEPLVHLLRNAIDHGIEMPEKRKEAGKTGAGTIKLIAKKERGFCTIEIQDDGKGMSSEEIKNKAIEKGLISENSSNQMTESEILELICFPGFSTVDKVTDISGRGVGMDVVKSLVESFNGKLDIRSKKNEGSSFTMRLPLTLAIIQALLVSVGSEIYAIPLVNINEIAPVDQADIKTIGKKEVLLLRNEVIPLIRIKNIFDCKGSDSKQKHAIIIEQNDEKIGIMIDEIISQQEIVIKTLTDLLKYSRYFSGATILGDGRVVLIIDTLTVCGG